MSKLVSLILCFIVFFPAFATAHVVFEPDWVGQEGTTFADWSFSEESTYTLPEQIANPYGTATASVTIGYLGEGWLASLPGVGTQTGLLDLGGAGGSLVLDIDNRKEPLPYKEIWVQVTYLLEPSQQPTVDIAGATLLDEQWVVIEPGVLGEWYLYFSKWRIEPNPPHEQIVLTSDPMWGSILDQVAVHTICIPEPTSLGLLAFGGLVFLRKRRK